MPLQRILVAFGLHQGQAVIDFAAGLAIPAQASLTLLHVVEPATLLGAIVPGARRETDSLAATSTSQRILEEMTGPLLRQGLKVSTVTREGSIVKVLLSEAERGQFDLIVMGLHGRTGLGRVLYGSVTEAVVGRAPCPVAIVRAGVSR